MRKPYIIPLTLICILFAFMLPSSLGKTHEVGAHPVHITQIKPISAPPHVKLATITAVEIKPPTVAQNVFNGSGDYALDWIISHESGGNPYAMNSIGACGLAQSLPCSKVLGACGSLDNVQCQIDWVRSYCISRYGSTEAAMSFWQQNQWY